MGANTQPKQVTVNPLKLGRYHANGLRSRRDLYFCQLLYAKNVRKCVGVRTDAAYPLEQIEVLRPIARFRPFFNSAMHVTQTDGCIGHHFPINGKFKMTGLL